MNSIRRPRKRPRVRSVSFRVLGWLLVREAYVRIHRGRPLDVDDRASRRTIMKIHTHVLRRSAERIMVVNDARRYYP